MRDLIVIFIILLVLLILISTFGGSIRYTPTWKSEKFEDESQQQPPATEMPPPEGVQLGAMPSEPETFMTVGAPADMKPPMEVGAPEGKASSYPTKEAGAALDMAEKAPEEETTLVEPFSGEAFAAACSSCTGCA